MELNWLSQALIFQTFFVEDIAISAKENYISAFLKEIQ
jgi:hypothetical protein